MSTGREYKMAFLSPCSLPVKRSLLGRVGFRVLKCPIGKPLSLARTPARKARQGNGFELPVPREKRGLAAPAIITLARLPGGAGGEFNSVQLPGPVCHRRPDHGDPCNKGHLIGQTHLLKPKDVRTIRVRPELGALPRHHRPYVIAARLDRPLPGLQLRMEHVPNMNHYGPDL